MTRVTTITEYTQGDKKIVTANSSDGLRARIVYEHDEAVFSTWDDDGEEDQQREHPEDALGSLLIFFFGNN